MFNVLLSCSGRRNYLLGCFRRALAGRGQVIATDASADASTLHEADRAFVVPRVDVPAYVDILLDLCAKHRIGLLLSLNDFELPLLAKHRERFRALGTVPAISSPEVIELCQDKWATYLFLLKLGVHVPRTWVTLEEALDDIRREGLSFPLVIKPRWGSGSLFIEYPASLEELKQSWRFASERLKQSALAAFSTSDPSRCLLVQERLAGEEHGLDIINDLDGKYVVTLAKRKLAMRAGETDKAVTVADAKLMALGRRLGESLGHVGNLDCDVFVGPDGVCRVLEMNPRFGGGYPFSHVAGADIPAALIAWASGQSPRPEWLTARPGVASAKCDRVILLGDIPHLSRA